MNELLELLLTDPDQIEVVVKQSIEKYKPLIYSLCGELLDIGKDYANNKEITKVNATLKKNQYDAYLEVGFTEDQAIAFIINDNLKLMENIKKASSSIGKLTSKK